VSERTGRELSAHNVHARLGTDGGVVFWTRKIRAEPITTLCGRGVELAGLVEDIMLVDPQRQWAYAELLTLLEAKGEDLPEVLDKYISNSLVPVATIQGMGRMVCRSRRAAGAQTRGRIDLGDACVQVLVQSGQPLHSLRSRSVSVGFRGTSEFFFIQPTRELRASRQNKWASSIEISNLKCGRARASFLQISKRS